MRQQATARPRSSKIAEVGTLLQAMLIGVFCQLAPGNLTAPLGIPPSAPPAPPAEAPTSIERIKDKLGKGPRQGLKLDVPIPVARPTFKARVDQKVFVQTLEEALHKQFDLNDLQRQSAEWSAKCCGYDLGALMKRIDKALDQRKTRKTREQIARELAELEAAAAKIPITVIK
jgi:hypothetical protein